MEGGNENWSQVKRLISVGLGGGCKINQGCQVRVHLFLKVTLQGGEGVGTADIRGRVLRVRPVAPRQEHIMVWVEQSKLEEQWSQVGRNSGHSWRGTVVLMVKGPVGLCKDFSLYSEQKRKPLQPLHRGVTCSDCYFGASFFFFAFSIKSRGPKVQDSYYTSNWRC